MTSPSLSELFLVGVAAAILSAILVLALMPFFARYALARPNARSAHKVPTPQGGGIAVVATTLAVVVVTASMRDSAQHLLQWSTCLALGAAFALALVGWIDDIRTIDVIPRLIFQALAVIAIMVTLPSDMRIVSAVPLWIERLALLFAGMWFVNLVNFMDGLDWMTVVEVVAVTLGICIIGFVGEIAPLALMIAAALLGAMVGFAPFNRPVARLFLGDVGSLPTGLLLFWLLIELAGNGYLAAALLLPLYYLADATITLLWRLAKGQNVTQAHRSHFYQVATERGLSVPAVIARVAAVNAGLVALAVLTAWNTSVGVSIAAVVAGTALVAGLLASFSRGKR